MEACQVRKSDKDRAKKRPSQNARSKMAANDAVDISNWSLFEREPASSGRPTPYLLGPIVGATTETTAR